MIDVLLCAYDKTALTTRGIASERTQRSFLKDFQKKEDLNLLFHHLHSPVFLIAE